MKVDKAINLIEKNDKAYLKIFSKKVPEHTQVAQLLDRATALQVSKDYKKSTEQFLRAERLLKNKDYYSLKSLAEGVLFDSSKTFYRPDAVERPLLNAMLQLNFLAQSRWDSALVESRKLDLYYKKKKEFQNPASFYFSGLAFEVFGDEDSAYIDYYRAYKINPFAVFRRSVFRMAKKTGRSLPKNFHLTPSEKKKWKFNKKNQGEFVLIHQQGWAARKSLPPTAVYANSRGQIIKFASLLPVLSKRRSFVKKVKVEIQGRGYVSAELLFNVTKQRIKTYNDQVFTKIAQEGASYLAQHAFWSSVLGEDVADIMYLFRQPDTRHWGLLPETFQVARVSLPLGKKSYRVHELDAQNRTVHISDWKKFELSSKQKTFLELWRTF